MAIDNNSRLIAALKLQSNNDPARGCGSVYVGDGRSLPAGDYVFAHPTSASVTTLSNIVFKGEPISDAVSATLAPVTSIALDSSRGGHCMWAMNIESCDVAGGNMIFYKRCK